MPQVIEIPVPGEIVIHNERTWVIIGDVGYRRGVLTFSGITVQRDHDHYRLGSFDPECSIPQWDIVGVVDVKWSGDIPSNKRPRKKDS